MSEQDDGHHDIVQPGVTPFTAQVHDLPDGKFIIQFYMPTGITVLFVEREALKHIGQLFIQHATGIVLPNEG